MGSDVFLSGQAVSPTGVFWGIAHRKVSDGTPLLALPSGVASLAEPKAGCSPLYTPWHIKCYFTRHAPISPAKGSAAGIVLGGHSRFPALEYDSCVAWAGDVHRLVFGIF